MFASGSVHANREDNLRGSVRHIHRNIRRRSHGGPGHLDSQGNIGHSNVLRKIHLDICIA